VLTPFFFLPCRLLRPSKERIFVCFGAILNGEHRPLPLGVADDVWPLSHSSLLSYSFRLRLWLLPSTGASESGMYEIVLVDPLPSYKNYAALPPLITRTCLGR
jgi:hypothetical protein